MADQQAATPENVEGQMTLIDHLTEYATVLASHWRRFF